MQTSPKGLLGWMKPMSIGPNPPTQAILSIPYVYLKV